MTIQTNHSIDTIISTITGVELVSGLQSAFANANAAFAEANGFQSIINSVFTLANSTTNLVTGAYSNANAAFAEANAFQSIINSAFTLANSHSNLIVGAYANANAALAEANAFQSIINSAFTLANSTTNLVTGAYANANAALAEANAFQSIINSSFSLTNSTTNLVTSAYNRANSGGAVNSVNVGGTYVLSSNDNGTIICFNNTNPLNVNTSVLNTAPGAVGAGLAGFRVIITQSNTGMVTIIQGPSTLLLPRVTGNNSIVSQNASVSLFVPTSNTFLLDGSIAGTPSSPGVGGGGGLQNTTDYMTGTLTVNNLTSNVGINTGIIIANTRLAVVGIDIGSGLASAYSSVNSTSNLIVGAYANANAALAEANAFQSIINTAFALVNTHSTSITSVQNLIVGAYANANAALAEANAFQSIINSAFTLANTAVQRATDVMSGVLTVPALTSTGGINTGIIFANTTIRATGNVIGGNLVTTGVVNSKTVIVNTVNVGGTYVLDANDSGTVICFNNATAVTVNTSSVNTGGTVVGAGFTGFRVLLTQVNTGMVTVQAGPGTTLLPRITGNNSISSQNGSMSLMVWSSNVYLMDGALSGNITTAPIVDTLVSTVITSALSANMGNFISNRDVSKAGDVMNGMLTVLGLQSNGQIIVNSLSCNTEANVTGNIFTSGPTSYIAAQTAIGITAAGIAQGTATALTRQINIITTCAGGANGVLLPIPPVGTEISVSNFGATACSVWPPSTHGIDSLGLNLRANCAPSGFRKFVRANTIHWYTTANGIFTGP